MHVKDREALIRSVCHHLLRLRPDFGSGSFDCAAGGLAVGCASCFLLNEAFSTRHLYSTLVLTAECPGIACISNLHTCSQNDQ